MVDEATVNEIKAQDFSEWAQRKEEKVVTVKGKKFLLKTPEDSDAVINALVSPNRANALKTMCMVCVSTPDINKLWDGWGVGEKMGLAAEVTKFLGLDDNFLERQKAQ
jgi:hypothetical protein